jgi:hypothetical protein
MSVSGKACARRRLSLALLLSARDWASLPSLASSRLKDGAAGKPFNLEDPMNNISADIAHKTFAYHPGVLQDLWIWVEASGHSADELKAVTETTIRTCHQAAIVEELPYGKQPLIYALGLGPIQVYYTIEQDIVIRGYCENIPRSYLEEDSSGGIYFDGNW